MRDFKGMKRQRGRNRNGGTSSSSKPQNNANRAFDSNGPEGVKVRGAAQHVYEKYQQLARDAHTIGDRVLAENHLQHADHYFRVLRAMQPQRPLSDIIGRDQFVSGYDIDFEDESGMVEGAESEAETDNQPETIETDRQPRFDVRRDDSRAQEPRTDRYQGDRNDRSDRSERTPEERTARPARDERAPREDRAPREERASREERPRYNREDRSPRADRRDRTEPAVIDPMPMVALDPAPFVAAPSSAMLRADDGEVSHAPAFLQARPPVPSEDTPTEARRPRRRRAPSTFAATEPSADDDG